MKDGTDSDYTIIVKAEGYDNPLLKLEGMSKTDALSVMDTVLAIIKRMEKGMGLE